MKQSWGFLRKSMSILLTGTYHFYIFLMILWIAFPMLMIIFASFQGDINVVWPPKAFTLDTYRQIPDSYWSSLRLSIGIAFVSTLLSILIATPCAWALVRGKLKYRSLLSNFVLIPMLIPALVMSISLLRFFRPLGLVNNYYGLLLALVGANGLALSLKYSEAVIEGISPSFEEAAMTLGANKFTVLWKIVLPLAGTGIVVSSVFVFMSNLMTFLLIYFIAGSFYMPISVKLFSDMADRGILPQSVAMSAILIFIAIGFYVFVTSVLGPSYFTGIGSKHQSK